MRHQTLNATPSKFAVFINDLMSDTAAIRARARTALMKAHTPEVTAALVGELSDPRAYVRWEATKVLVALGDAVTAPALLQELDDDDHDVRWAAAEGLVALGEIGLFAVLHELTKKARSVAFCRSAHQVLKAFTDDGPAEEIAPVILALEKSEPALSVPTEAFKALTKLKVEAGLH